MSLNVDSGRDTRLVFLVFAIFFDVYFSIRVSFVFLLQIVVMIFLKCDLLESSILNFKTSYVHIELSK